MDKIGKLICDCKAHSCSPGCDHLRELALCTGPKDVERVVREYLCTAPTGVVEDLSWNMLQTGLHLSDDAWGLGCFQDLAGLLCDKCDPTPLFFSATEVFSDPGVSTEKKGRLLWALPRAIKRLRSETRRHSFSVSCLGFVRSVLEQCREEASADNDSENDNGEGEDEAPFRAVEYSDIACGGSGVNGSVLDGVAAFIEGLCSTTPLSPQESELFRDVAVCSASVLMEAVCESGDSSDAVSAAGTSTSRRVVDALKDVFCCGVEYVLTLVLEAKRSRIREERALAFRARFHPTDDDDESGDEESSSRSTKASQSELDNFKLPEVGLGAWLHELVLGRNDGEEQRFPGAAERVWAYKAVLTAVVPMLDVPCMRANFMAWDLLRVAVTSVRGWWGLDGAVQARRCTLKRGLGPHSADPAGLAALVRAMLGNVVHLSDAAARDRGTALLQGFWGTMRPALRFDVLVCLLDTISVELIPHVVRQIKREIVHAWPNSSIVDRSRDGKIDDGAGEEDGNSEEAAACFCSPRVVQLFQRMLSAEGRVFGQLKDRFASCSDAALDILNLYRFVLLRDASTNYTGLLNRSQIAEANRVSIAPVRVKVAECIREYGGYCSSPDVARRKIASFAALGLPQISLSEFQAAASRHLLKAYLIEDVLKRIEEITTTFD